ncbi:hypothetical protein AAU57_12920 [Nonlabens sp. YIK11]|nr:hypothetical protein AAU57_12920 [Nonlabens sp. YIK11]
MLSLSKQVGGAKRIFLVTRLRQAEADIFPDVMLSLSKQVDGKKSIFLVTRLRQAQADSGLFLP